MISVLTAFIAALVALITFLQWVTARGKVRLDLFDKRFAVYDELRSAKPAYPSPAKTNGLLEAAARYLGLAAE
jgi:hypothetical protein